MFVHCYSSAHLSLLSDGDNIIDDVPSIKSWEFCGSWDELIFKEDCTTEDSVHGVEELANGLLLYWSGSEDCTFINKKQQHYSTNSIFLIQKSKFINNPEITHIQRRLHNRVTTWASHGSQSRTVCWRNIARWWWRSHLQQQNKVWIYLFHDFISYLHTWWV